MLYWALVFLVVALVAGLLGFGGIAATSAGIARTIGAPIGAIGRRLIWSTSGGTLGRAAIAILKDIRAGGGLGGLPLLAIPLPILPPEPRLLQHCCWHLLSRLSRARTNHAAYYRLATSHQGDQHRELCLHYSSVAPSLASPQSMRA